MRDDVRLSPSVSFRIAGDTKSRCFYWESGTAAVLHFTPNRATLSFACPWMQSSTQQNDALFHFKSSTAIICFWCLKPENEMGWKYN